MTEPQCHAVDITVTTGGKVQIVQFKLSNSFELGYTESYTIPADWTEERREEWRVRKIDELKAKIDDFAQAEQDSLLASSDWYQE